MSEVPDILADYFAKIQEFVKFLEGEFVAPCEEDDYTNGCLSCDAGAAVRHLKRMLDTMAHPHPSESEKVK